MRARSILLVVVAALVLGTLAVGLASPPEARASGCPDQPLTVADLDRLFDAQPGTLGFAMGNPRGLACYGRSDIRIRGFANWPDGLGGTSAYWITPQWLTNGNSLIIFGSRREVAPGYGAGTYYGISVPTRFGHVEKRYHRVWVDITAHFDDPAARTCRPHGPASARPTRAASVRYCRSILVLASIRRASGPPDTGFGPVAAASGPGTPRDGTGPSAILSVVAILGVVAGLRRAGGRHPSRAEVRPPRSRA